MVTPTCSLTRDKSHGGHQPFTSKSMTVKPHSTDNTKIVQRCPKEMCMLTLILTSVATITHQTAVSFRQSGRENEGFVLLKASF